MTPSKKSLKELADMNDARVERTGPLVGVHIPLTRRGKDGHWAPAGFAYDYMSPQRAVALAQKLLTAAGANVTLTVE